MTLYIHQDGQQLGPYTEEEVRTFLAEGRLKLSDLAWSKGASEWKPLSSVSTFAQPSGAGLATSQTGIPQAPVSTPPASTLNQSAKETKKTPNVLTLLSSIAGAAIGYYAVKAVPFQTTVQCLAGLVAGLLCGLIPYFMAKKRNNLKLAKLALWICALSGLLLGLLLAIPVCVAFVVIILVSKRRE